jgi:hypothetical protein
MRCLLKTLARDFVRVEKRYFRMIKEHQLVSIFCDIDDFRKELDKNMSQLQLKRPTKGGCGSEWHLAIIEIMIIQVLFQMIRYRNFKTFYTGFLQVY